MSLDHTKRRSCPACRDLAESTGCRRCNGYGRVCPVCEAAVAMTCRCMRSDSTCANGHKWHYCLEHGAVVVGESDHGTQGCTCSSAHGRSVSLEGALQSIARLCEDGTATHIANKAVKAQSVQGALKQHDKKTKRRPSPIEAGAMDNKIDLTKLDEAIDGLLELLEGSSLRRAKYGRPAKVVKRRPFKAQIKRGALYKPLSFRERKQIQRLVKQAQLDALINTPPAPPLDPKNADLPHLRVPRPQESTESALDSYVGFYEINPPLKRWWCEQVDDLCEWVDHYHKTKEEVSRKKHKQFGFLLVKERVQFPGGKPFVVESAITPEGYYVGSRKTAAFLYKRMGLSQLQPSLQCESAEGRRPVASLGFCEANQKWYGWSHRAIAGFGVGDVVREGSLCATSGYTDDYLSKNPEADRSLPVGFTAKNLDDAKRMAVAFAEAVA